MSVSDTLDNINSLGLFSGDMNGNNTINTVDSNNIYSYSLNRRPLLTIKKFIGLIDSGNITGNITFKHIHKYNLVPYREFKYFITPYINNVQYLKTQFAISDINSESKKEYEYVYSLQIEGEFVETDLVKFKIEYSVAEDSINTDQIPTYIPTFYTNNFNFISPNFKLNDIYNLGVLGLFSGDMNGNNIVNTIDTNNMYNYSLNRRPILSLQGISNRINTKLDEITTELKFVHIHKYNVAPYRDFKYYITPIIDGLNYPEQEFIIYDTNLESKKMYQYVHTETTLGNFSSNSTVKYNIKYKYKEDIGSMYISNFNFKTPEFIIGEPSYDLAPQFTRIKYENNASIIAILDDDEISIKENDRLVVFNSEDDIISYQSLNIAKNIPELPSPQYYFAGIIGLTKPNEIVKYKYWDSEYQTLYNLSYSSGTDPINISADNIIGTPQEPVIFTIN